MHGFMGNFRRNSSGGSVAGEEETGVDSFEFEF